MCGSVRGSAVLCGSVCTRWCARCALALGRVQGRVQEVVAGRFWCSYAWVSLTPTAPARPRGCLHACVRGCRRACVRACSPVRVPRRVHAGVCVRVHVCVRSFRRRRWWCRRCVHGVVLGVCVLCRCVRCGVVVWPLGRVVRAYLFCLVLSLYLLFVAWYRYVYRSLYRYVF